MVRETLGEDAIIIATREEKNAVGGAMVHLTAAIDKDTFSEDETTDSASSDWLYDDDDNEAMVVEEITETMLQHGVPDEILDQIVSCAAIMDEPEPRPAMMSALENLYKFSPLPRKESKKPIMMIGPPGAGKTLATAKLAARSAMNGMKVAVITTDIERAGGREQLQAFTALMDIDLQIAQNTTALKEALLKVSDADQIIIDTAGTNPFDTDQVKTLARLVGAADMMPVLVLPAGMQADEAGEMAQIFATIGAQSLLPTRIDVARRLGSLLCAAYAGNLAFTERSATAKVADGLSQLTSKRLTQLLMPRANTATMLKSRNAG